MSSITSNPAYALNETMATVIKERTFLVEEILNGCGWGVMFVIYWQSMNVIFFFKKKRDWFLGTYASLLFIIGTIYLVGCIILTGKIFIDNRNVPGGPTAAIVDVYSQPVDMMGNAAYPLQSWLSDALIIYRCSVIYSHNLWIIAFPSLLLLGSIVTGSMVLAEDAHPNVGFWSKISVNLAIPYFSLTIAINVIVTMLIVFRLLMHRKMITAALGSSHAKQYVSVSAMLVESAALNTTCSLIFLILYARGNPGSNIFQGLVVFCQITAAMLIVLRVAKGQAWTRDTSTSTYPPATSLLFAKSNTGQKTMSQNDSSLPTGNSSSGPRDIQIHLEEGSKEICMVSSGNDTDFE